METYTLRMTATERRLLLDAGRASRPRAPGEALCLALVLARLDGQPPDRAVVVPFRGRDA